MTRREFAGALPALRADTKGTWVRLRDLPEPRIFERATATSGRIYVVTSGEDGKRETEVHEYDPGSDSWTARSWANTLRHWFGAGSLDGRIYIWGGVANGRVIASAEIYDPEEDQWFVITPMPRPRMFAKGARVGGQFPWLDAYGPQRDRWSLASDMPLHRDADRVAVARGRVYVVGQLGLGADTC